MNLFRVALALAVGLLGTAPANATPPERVDVLIGFTLPPGPAEEEMVRGMGGDIKHTFQLVPAIAANVPVTAIPGLSRNPRVRYVEPDQVVSAVVQTTPWGIDRIFGDEGYAFPTWAFSTGAGVTVAVLDTGIDKNHIDLPSLLHGTNTIDDTDWGIDLAGHGTHVAGTIAALDNTEGVVGVAPNVGLYAVKVLGGVDGEGTDSSVAAGIEWAVTKGILVVNMSLGGPDYSQTLEEACDAAYAAGHLLIAAAGNGYVEGEDTVLYPARYESVIAVAASTQFDERASFSSTGPAVELIAPGQNVYSTYRNDSYWTMSGTSMASPHVAGVAALAWAANPLLSNVQIRRILQDTAETLGLLEEEHQGYGLVRADLAVAAAMVTAPSVTTDPATGVTGQAATLNGTLVNYGWELCEYSFQYGTQQGGPYLETAWIGQLGSGAQFSEALSQLDEGTTYYFVARARNSAGIGYGHELTFTTKPQPPTNLLATPDDNMPFYRIDLTWVAGDGASWTHVRVSQGVDYPASPSDGALVYEGDGTSFAHSGLEPSTLYKYRAWSRVEDHFGEDVWSDLYADAEAMTAVEPPTVDFGITLQPGWNMVSVPLLMKDISTSTVFAFAEAVYTWNPDSKSYVAPANIEPEKAYWVAVASPTPLDREWTGVPVTAWSSQVATGWNMVGSVYYSSSGEPVAVSSLGDDPPDSILSNAIYNWDPVSKSYTSADTIEKGKGYWLATTSDCTLSMSAL